LLIVLQSNFVSAFHITAFCINFSVISACALSAMNAPFAGSVFSMLLIGAFADSMSSGPPGLYHLLCMLAYFALAALALRVRSQRAIFIVVVAALTCAAFDLLYGMILAIIYPESTILQAIPSVLWRNAIATAIFTPPYFWLISKANAIWLIRSQSGLRRKF